MMAFNGHLNWILAWWMDSISGFLVNQIFIPSAPFFNFVKDGCMRQRSGKIPNGIFSRVLKLICFFFESSDPVILSTIPLSSLPHTSWNFFWMIHHPYILFWPYMVFKSVCPLWDEIDVVHHNHHHHDVLETLFVNSTCDITIFLKLLSCHSARHSWQ